jgi:hypothetical protein
MAHRFIHLSDIHFGQEKHGTLPKHEAVRKALLKDAKQLAETRGAPSRVLVTGDVAFSGKPEQFETAAQWLDELTRSCGCKEVDVSTIPGNHDCDRNAISAQAKIVYATLRASSPEVAQAQLHDISKDGESASPFLPKLHAYRKFANAYGCDFASAEKPFWTRLLDLPGGIKVRLVGLTSVQVSNDDDALGKMLLGNEQYIFEEEDNVVSVVLLHHPFDWFIDKVEASQYICNRARVILVGHEHSLNIHKTTDHMSGREWLVIYAGATNPAEQELKFIYNWLEFSCEEKDGVAYLVTEIFPRAWVPERVCFEADRNRIVGGAESIRVEIVCTNVRMITANQQVGKQIASGRTSAVSPIAESAGQPEKAQLARKGGRAMVKDSAGFDRLRYLFWRHLDWRQRLKVLVDVNALPETADQPLPQILERVALETAAKDVATLHRLWEAVMPLIPAEKRDTNPF